MTAAEMNDVVMAADELDVPPAHPEEGWLSAFEAESVMGFTVFGPEYVFGHIILMSTFRTMDVFGHGCHSKLRSLSSRIQNQDSRGFHARHRPGPANQKTCLGWRA